MRIRPALPDRACQHPLYSQEGQCGEPAGHWTGTGIILFAHYSEERRNRVPDQSIPPIAYPLDWDFWKLTFRRLLDGDFRHEITYHQFDDGSIEIMLWRQQPVCPEHYAEVGLGMEAVEADDGTTVFVPNQRYYADPRIDEVHLVTREEVPSDV